MKYSRSRFVSLFFVFLTVFSSLFLCSYTETDDFFRYTSDEEGNLHIVGYVGYEHTLTVPAEIGGKKVVAIDATAFYGNSEIRRITVSAGIKRVEKDAFAYCENLSHVTFEEGSCVFLGESAFEGCALLETVEFPGTLAEIDDFCFRGCIRLGGTVMPASLTQIGYHAFADCESLVFDAKNCPAAKAYAEENGIDLSFGESAAFLWLKVAGGCVLLLLLLLGGFFLLKRRKKGAGRAAAFAQKSASDKK